VLQILKIFNIYIDFLYLNKERRSIKDKNVLNPKSWTQNGVILFNFHGQILPIPIVLKFDRCQVS